MAEVRELLNAVTQHQIDSFLLKDLGSCIGICVAVEENSDDFFPINI